MNYGILIMKIPILLLFSSLFLATNGDVLYVPKITDSVFGCDNFDNKYLNCDDLKLGSLKGDDGDDAATLSGSIETFVEIDSQHDIQIEILKMTDMGNEYMYSVRTNLCASLKETDVPWKPIIEELNITSCPIPVSIMEAQGLTISLDSMKDMMCHDFCGEYVINFSFMDGADKISCHVLEICIVEENDEVK